MDNLIWWIMTGLYGLTAIVNFIRAGKGDHEVSYTAGVCLVSGFIATGLTLWALLTLI